MRSIAAIDTAEKLIWQGEVLRTSTKEFLLALGNTYTYNIARNIYITFGVLCGLPIPFFSIGIYMMLTGTPLTIPAFVTTVIEHPLHLILILHPVLFGVVFGAMGTIKSKRDRDLLTLIERVQTTAEDLRKANEQLQELDRMKGEILANVTHELKTPLISISGYNEMLLEERLGPLNAKQKEGMRTSLRNVERLLYLIDEMLELAKIDAGRMKLFPTAFSISEAVRNAAASFMPVATKKNVILTSKEPPEDLLVTADREKIAMVLNNLIANAVKFTGEGGSVTTVVRAVDDRVVVTVADTGCGIEESAQRKIFDRFWQADGSGKRKHGGVGLGMAIVKELLDAHGFPISVKSGLGVGTEVTVIMPMSRSPAPPKGVEISS